MRKSLVAVAFAVVVLLGASAFAGSISITNSNFSSVAIACTSGYSYQQSGLTVNTCDNSGGGFQQSLNGASGIGWTFADGPGVGQPFFTNQYGDGLTVANSPFNPPPFGTFTQAAFLQGAGSYVSQTLSGFTVGQAYDLSFLLGSRYNGGGYNGNQIVEVLLGGNVIKTYDLGSSTPFTLENIGFTATSTTETLEFEGTNSGDHTAFLTNVGITATPEPVTLMLFGTGLLGIGGMVRRRLNR